jgi:hypothetical protein
MYLKGIRGMGFMEYMGIASSLLSLATKSTPQAQPVPPSGGNIMVSTAVQTTVSPQISPVFVQQDEPRDSPVTAATVQMVTAPQVSTMPTPAGTPTPGAPVTGAIPGIDGASGYLPTGVPGLPSVPAAPAIDTMTLALGVGIIGLAMVLKGKKKVGAKRGRR